MSVFLSNRGIDTHDIEIDNDTNYRGSDDAKQQCKTASGTNWDMAALSRHGDWPGRDLLSELIPLDVADTIPENLLSERDRGLLDFFQKFAGFNLSWKLHLGRN